MRARSLAKIGRCQSFRISGNRGVRPNGPARSFSKYAPTAGMMKQDSTAAQPSPAWRRARPNARHAPRRSVPEQIPNQRQRRDQQHAHDYAAAADGEFLGRNAIATANAPDSFVSKAIF